MHHGAEQRGRLFSVSHFILSSFSTDCHTELGIGLKSQNYSGVGGSLVLKKWTVLLHKSRMIMEGYAQKPKIMPTSSYHGQ